ncbi:MAG: 4-(cytidine 5'-diphospho)-2-C-methyl-D-erythritol kinase [Bryobacterales bacterium]|nr:4-(cytidine 5'-diphospho)-2-C-methyl-D-erythritol kinase [Bryobacterales bacterium]
MAEARTVHVKALAKINLSLRVLYKRADNYHELRTVFQTISLSDEITLIYQPARITEVTVECTVPIENNLAVKAAHAVLEAAKAHGKVHLILEKRIPMGGGLGGGSTDAAAVLLALSALMRRPLPKEKLAELAATLGSDVPFFLIGGTVLGMGRGEELYPFPQPDTSYGILLTPEIHVSTAEAYQSLGRTLTQVSGVGFAMESWGIGEGASLEQWRRFCANDFEEPVFARHPELGELRNRMEAAGAIIARMTGSGAAIFGLFPSRSHAVEAASLFPDTPNVLFRTVDKRQYDRQWGKILS